MQLGAAAEDAELVAFGIGQHDPAGAVGFSEVGDFGGTEVQQSLQLLVAGAGDRPQVEVQPVLDLLGLGYLDEQDPVPALPRRSCTPWPGSFGSSGSMR